MTTESFNQFTDRVEQAPPTTQSQIARLVLEAKQGGQMGAVARMALRSIPGGTEALIASTSPPLPYRPRAAPPPAPPAPPPVAAPPAPPAAPPPDPSLFDKTLGRGIGAVGRGVLGVGRFVQPAAMPVLENLGKAIETGVGTGVSTFGALTPGDFMGLEKNLAEERARRGIQTSLPTFMQASPLLGLENLIRGNLPQELQAQAAAWRATDMPSTTWNALPGQGIPLPGGKRLDEIDVGVKGAFELLPELGLGIATGGGSAAGGLARRTATSAANVLGADIAKLGAKGALGAGRAATRGAKAVMPSGSAAKQAAARGAGGVGQPVRVFHGTDQDAFDAFDINLAGTSTDEGFLGRGVYFSTDPNIGRTKTRTIQASINPKSPLRIEGDLSTPKQNLVQKALGLPEPLTGQALTDAVTARGFDSVILDYAPSGYPHQEIVLFDPSSAKLLGDIDDVTRSALRDRDAALARGEQPPPVDIPITPARQADVAADVEPRQLKFDFIDEPDISPVTGKPSVVDEAFEANQTKAVELPEGYGRSPGLIEDLIPKIVSPDVVRRAVEKSKKLLRAARIRNEQLNPSTLPGMAMSAVIKAAPARIGSASNRLAQDIRGQLTKRDADGNRLFEFSDDDMRIENIADKVSGNNPRLSKLNGRDTPLEPKPTIADLAQDYGAYRHALNDDQKAVMDHLRVRAEGLAADLEEFGFNVDYKAELGDGGFFISRGPTRQKRDARVQEQQRTTKESYRKGRATDLKTGVPFTQVEMIEKGSEYLPVWDEYGQWSTEIYESILDKQLGKFVKEYEDPATGKKIALTTSELAGELSIDAQRLRAEISAARRTLKNQKVRLTAKQQEYVRAFREFDTYTSKLSTLRAKLAEAVNAKAAQKIVKNAHRDANRVLNRAEEVLKARQGNLQIAKMHSADLQDQVDSLVKFEKVQDDLLANAAQRLEAQQLKGDTPKTILAASQREVRDAEKFVARTKGLRERAERLTATARKREDAADAAEGGAAVDVTLKKRDFDELEKPADADVDFYKARLELRKFRNEVTARREAMDRAGTRLDTAKRKVAESQLKLIKLEDKLKQLEPKIEAAVNEATKVLERSTLKYRSINGNIWLDPDDLQTIKRSQQGMEATRGKLAPIIGPISTYQSIRRAIGATLDDSGISIQGKLRQFSNTREYYLAWKDHLQSLIGKPGRKGKRLQRESMSDNVRKFDEESQAMGAPSSHEIIDRMGIRFGGVDTEVTLRPEGITGTIGKAPLIRRANEAFGAFGDMLRLRDARKEIIEYMRLSGKTFDELVADGTARKIGNGVNGVTGWTPNGVAGVFGDMLLFAPRFFRARIETLHRAIKGMDTDFMIDALPFDRQIRRNLNINYGIRNSIDADQLIARRAVIKLVSMGTLITVAANEVLGQETDFQLMRNGRMNPNFMSVRLTKLGAPRDWNIFGPYKSMAALMLASGGAGWEKEPQKALDAWLNLSSPVVGDLFEFMNFRAYGESRFGETLGEYIAESHIPFALQEVPNIIKETSIGNPKDAFGGGLSIGLELIGEQSSPLSRSDILQDHVGGLFRSGMVSADNYEDLEPYEKNDVKDSLVAELEKFEIESAATGKPLRRFFATVDIINRRRDSQLQEAMFFFYAGQRSDGGEYTKRDFIDDYFDIIDDARERKEQVEETLNIEWKDKVIADDDLEAQALAAWHEAPSKSLTAAGSYLPDKMKRLRDKVLKDYPQQADYIIRNTNDTPLPQGFLEALERAGLKSTVERIKKSDAARQARGAPARAVVPSEALIPPEQPSGIQILENLGKPVSETVLRTRELLAP